MVTEKDQMVELLTDVVKLVPAEELFEMLARAYQNNRDAELQDWYDFGPGGESAQKAFRCDQIGQKLLKIIRDLEVK